MTIDEATKAVVAAARARSAALVAGDRRRLAALLHPRLRWTTYRGAVLDREQYLTGNVGGALVWVEQTLLDVDVQIVGDAVAVLTALVVDVVNRDGVQETFRLRLTQTWVNSADGWQCLAGHAGPRVD
ncbi:nuclear transport factor 2 family protein [Dactylosporangium sp. McL0621]|uniref:nuclear transport factor 2 family protein n=1 Tax=Dactylosporangium sp. McL0621 TaxID=3415678 RepID=UPI003CEEC307